MVKSAQQSPEQILHLRISLDDVKPKVSRVIAVPFGIWLDTLHLVFQAAMGWTNSHQYLIKAGGCAWGSPSANDSEDEPMPANKASLADLVADTASKRFKYIYDFAHEWRHTVSIVKLTVAAPGVAYPLLLEATGRCPPEDIGGRQGYQEMLSVLSDTTHQRHAEFVERYGHDFDPKTNEKDELEQVVAALAQLMTRRKVRKPRSRQV
jgi:hypothetical protein